MLIYSVKLLLKIFRKTGFSADFFAAFRAAFRPRFSPFRAKVYGRPVQGNDALSFLVMYEEIFVREIYDFPTDKPAPRIIDGGANIGLSSLYWKHKFPAAEIIAFEPDPAVFALLQTNFSGQTEKPEFHQKALWTEETVLKFASDGAAGGKITEKGSREVPAVALADWLDRPTDLLKIDIEGAETEVLEACADKLHFVNYLFAEYHDYHDRPTNLQRLLGILDRAGFTYYIEQNGPTARHPFFPKGEEGNYYLNIFCRREK